MVFLSFLNHLCWCTTTWYPTDESKSQTRYYISPINTVELEGCFWVQHLGFPYALAYMRGTKHLADRPDKISNIEHPFWWPAAL